jgi:hypothetical protein
LRRYKDVQDASTIEHHPPHSTHINNSTTPLQTITFFLHKNQPIQPTFNMQFTITAVLAFAATAAFAAPLDERQVGLCSSGNPVCCATDVLNLANLDCAPRTVSPFSTHTKT